MPRALFRGLLRVFVDTALGEFAQGLVGLFLLAKRLLQELRRIAEPEFVGPGDERAVSRNLVMLDGLRRSEQAGVQRRRALVLLHYLLALGDDAHDGVAGLALRFGVDFLEHLFETRDVLFGLPLVLLESLLQFVALCGFGHLGQRGQDFLFGEVDVLQRVVKQVVQRFVGGLCHDGDTPVSMLSFDEPTPPIDTCSSSHQRRLMRLLDLPINRRETGRNSRSSITPAHSPITTSLAQCASRTTRVKARAVPPSQIHGVTLGSIHAAADATAPICIAWPEGNASSRLPDLGMPCRGGRTRRSGRSWSMMCLRPCARALDARTHSTR